MHKITPATQAVCLGWLCKSLSYCPARVLYTARRSSLAVPRFRTRCPRLLQSGAAAGDPRGLKIDVPKGFERRSRTLGLIPGPPRLGGRFTVWVARGERASELSRRQPEGFHRDKFHKGEDADLRATGATQVSNQWEEKRTVTPQRWRCRDRIRVSRTLRYRCQARRCLATGV
jgi:hypothetical protein